jgi:hypothetical protein
MNPIINTVQMTVGDREFVLADVIKSIDYIGTCTVINKFAGKGEQFPVTELFYMGDEPIVSMIRPSMNDSESNRVMSQNGTNSVCDEHALNRIKVSADNHFLYSQSLSKSLHPVLELLSPGLYVCYEANMIPSDGAGSFFWNAYCIRHDVQGSAEHNNAIGNNNFVPAFLVPTKYITEFDPSQFSQSCDKIKQGKRVGGVAYHLTGLFSALLTGHHNAAACLENDREFGCLVIEQVKNVMYESDEIAAEHFRNPRVTALSSPYVKIPLGEVPADMLENFLINRRHKRNGSYSAIRSKMNRSIKSFARKRISSDLQVKAEALPDCSMVESVSAVRALSEEQLEALLAGETYCNGQIIINENYYNSIVTACSFLQYNDFDRFLLFAFDVMNNPDLSATHKAISDRLINITNNAKIYNFFKEIAASEDDNLADLKSVAEVYLKRSVPPTNEEKFDNRIKAIIAKREREADKLADIEKMKEIAKVSPPPN